MTTGVGAGGVGGVTIAALRRSKDSCNCFCWDVSLVFSVAQSEMMSPRLISCPSAILRSVGSATLTVTVSLRGEVDKSSELGVRSSELISNSEFRIPNSDNC
ncbi:hypothetical protein IQ238_29735 [Pleurocapsales cyanobacterium LEGE 06147]|nr:hypothetical protein [Pleurocapsales cyanobacterium LEGE 06147]